MTAWLAVLPLTWAGYGDPVLGVPNHREREVHLWTNAARVAPEAFAADYPCAFGGFEPGEQTAKVPLWWHDGLGRIARAHSADMDSTGIRTHDSSDGTPSIARLNSAYTGAYKGENVGEGYDGDAWSIVIEGWMCSAGHRAGVMNANYQHLGTGVVGRFWTQDFGGDDLDPTPNGARLGVHLPEEPGASADYLLAVWAGETADVSVVINGAPQRMTVAYGAAGAGIYEASAAVDADCTAYWFEVDGDSYPEEGAYGFGDCPWDDTEARWMLRANVPALQGEADADEKGCGCSKGGDTAWLVLFAPLALLRRRSR